MVLLELRRPHWIKNEGDDPDDQCAHGYIEFAVNDVLFISESDGPWTVSAAALFLLRTVFSEHGPDDAVTDENVLIPCCGFDVFPIVGGKYEIVILGCTSGYDIQILHDDEFVCIALDDRSARIPRKEWAHAVKLFSDQVQMFYDSCASKNEPPDDEDKRGWELFWQEWSVLRRQVRDVVENA